MIPEFLLIDASKSSIDRQRLISDLQRYCLWREVYGNKPFNDEEAFKLQQQLGAERDAHLCKLAEKAIEKREQAEQSLRRVCREIVEHVFDVEISFSADEISASTPFGWETDIRDKATGETIGTPRSLLVDDGVNWASCGDPRKNLAQFIQNLKRYDGFTRPYAFERPRRTGNWIFKAPLPKEYPKFARFSIMLTLQPFNDAQILKTAKKWLRGIPNV